jgi:carnitine 3-dehydrogenase
MMPDEPMNTQAAPPAAERTIGRVAVIGTGTVGASWATLFLAHGLDVAAHDPAPGAQDRLESFIESARPQLWQAGARGEGRLTFASTLGDAVAGADFVQENAPESYDLKKDLLRAIDEAAPQHGIVASSTSSLLRSRMVESCPRPWRIIVAHPFNPPHIIPLVEILGDDGDVIARAEAFYKGIGKTPVRLQREAVGHVANRLTAALLREALYMVEQGIADVEAIDQAVRSGPGLRWAVMGPFLTYHLGGGQGGITHYLEHLGPSQVERWKDLGTPNLDAALMQRIIAGVDATYGDVQTARLSELHNKKIIRILQAMNDATD